MRKQVLVQLNEAVLRALDERAVEAHVSRSELIRIAVDRFLSQDLAARIDAEIRRGYEKIPPPPDPWVDLLAQRSIAEEPW